MKFFKLELQNQPHAPSPPPQMKFFKLELQNREENFNQRFGGGPRVGLVDPRAGKGGAGGGGVAMRSLNGGGMNPAGSMHALGAGGMRGVGASGNGSRRETPPAGESAETIAARLARDEARAGSNAKRPTRDLAQGAGMHAALGLGAAGVESGSSARLQPAAAQAKRKGSEGRLTAPANLVS